ncbi:MAG: cation:proton antiporter [Ilumatobacteraceae bacterium]
MTSVLLALAVVVASARCVGAVALRLGQPRVVGEIVSGILLGPSVLGLVANGRVVDRLFDVPTRNALGVLGQIALLLFMFGVGLSMDTAMLRGRARAYGSVAVSVVAAPVVGGFALLPVLHDDRFTTTSGTAQVSAVAFALLVGAMLSVTAFPVMYRILQEHGLERTELGVLATAAAAVVTVLMFVVVAIATAVHEGAGVAAIVRVPIESTLYLAGMAFVVRPALARMVGERFEAGVERPETFALVFVVLFGSGWLAAEVGLGVIVGGFVAGLVLPARELLSPVIARRLGDLVTAVLLPVFLAVSGLATDLTTLGFAWLPGLALLLVAAVLSKWLVGAAVARLVGLGTRDANALGILLNCRGLLVLVVGVIGLEEGIITPQLQVGSVLVALVTTAMTSPMFLAVSSPRREPVDQ